MVVSRLMVQIPYQGARTKLALIAYQNDVKSYCCAKTMRLKLSTGNVTPPMTTNYDLRTFTHKNQV